MKLIPGEWRYFDETLNMPYPWYTKPCLQFLEMPGMGLWDKKVFEYGVGDSTFWWKAKGAEVLGVDDNKEWAEKLNMMYRNSEASYVNAIDGRKYDIIVVDGKWRKECALYAANFLTEKGFMILDNFEQPSVDEDWTGVRLALEDRFGMRIEVFKEHGHIDWQTAIVR